jgi:hypothetical protein
LYFLSVFHYSRLLQPTAFASPTPTAFYLAAASRLLAPVSACLATALRLSTLKYSSCAFSLVRDHVLFPRELPSNSLARPLRPPTVPPSVIAQNKGPISPLFSVTGAAIVTMALGMFESDLLNIVYTCVTPFILTELTVSLEITISYVPFFLGLRIRYRLKLGPRKPTAPSHLVERLQSRKNKYRVTSGFIHMTIRQCKCNVHTCQVRRR